MSNIVVIAEARSGQVKKPSLEAVGAAISLAGQASAQVVVLVAGAGLDVYEREPAVDPSLMGLDNCVLLPHMASATQEARTEMGEKVIINIKAFTDGHKPPDRVLQSMF